MCRVLLHTLENNRHIKTRFSFISDLKILSPSEQAESVSKKYTIFLFNQVFNGVFISLNKMIVHDVDEFI